MQPIILLQCILVTVSRCFQATWIVRERLSHVSLELSEKEIEEILLKKKWDFFNLAEVSYWAISHP